MKPAPLHTITRTPIALLFALCLCAQPSLAQDHAAAKFATPADVLAAAQQAHFQQDYAALADCLSPAGQEVWVRSLFFMTAPDALANATVTMSVRSGDQVSTTQATMTPTTAPGDPQPSPQKKEALAKLHALMAKFGVKDPARLPGEKLEPYATRLTGQITDKRNFLVALMTLMHSTDTKPPRSSTAQLADLKIAGDSAGAQLLEKLNDGSAMSMHVKFDRIDGSWRISSIIFF